MPPVIVDGTSLTLEAFDEVVRGGAVAEVAPEALENVRKSRSVIDNTLKQSEAVYGVNTGLGKLAEVAIEDDKLEELQVNLVRSHAAGVGDPLPDDVVRGVMLLKLKKSNRCAVPRPSRSANMADGPPPLN